MRSSNKWLVFLVMALCALLTNVAFAQSREQNPDRRTINATMDPVLEGDWAGRGQDPGMRTDPLAIACMVRKCASIRAAFPNDRSQWRNSRNFAQCYMEHSVRVRRQEYVPIANPPQVHLLGCGLIEAQRHSYDDRVYVAVNGHARPQPLQQPMPSASAPARNGPPATEEDLRELAALAAQYDGGLPVASASASPPPLPASASAAPMKDDNPYKDEPPTKRPVPPPKVATDDNPYVAPASPPPSDSMGSGFGGLGDKLQLLYANDDEAAIRVLSGGQFYTIRASWLSKKYDTDWKSARKHAKAMNKQFIGACFDHGSVKLDSERMHLHPWSLAELNAPPNDKFVEECEGAGGEYRFALQAGEVIRLAASSDTKTQNDAPVARTQPAVNQDPPSNPAPVATTASEGSPATDAPTAPPPAVPPVPTVNDQSGLPEVDAGQTPPANQPDATNANDPLGRAFGHDRTLRHALVPEGERMPPPATDPTSGSLNGRLPAEMNEGDQPSDSASEANPANGRPNQYDSVRTVDPFPK